MSCSVITEDIEKISKKLGKNKEEVNAMRDIILTLMGDENVELINNQDSELLESIITIGFNALTDKESIDRVYRRYNAFEGFDDVNPLTKIIDALKGEIDGKIKSSKAEESFVNKSKKRFDNNGNMIKFTESVSIEEFIQAFCNGEMTVDINLILDKISSFSDLMIKSGINKALIEAFRKIRGGKGLKIHFVTKRNNYTFSQKPNMAGYYSAKLDEIFINIDSSFTFGVDSNGNSFNRLTEAIFHELAHAVTYYTITNNEEIQKEGNELLASIKEELSKKGINTEAIYGLKDVHEMVSEIFSSNFNNILNMLNMSQEQKLTLWQRIVNFFKNIFKENKQTNNNALNAVRGYLERIVDNQINDIPFNIAQIDTSRVDIRVWNKPWKNDGTKSNIALDISLKNQKDKGVFQLVKDKEDGYYSVHFKTATKNGEFNQEGATISSKEERKILFEELVKAIPEGAKVSTWGEISPDGIKGLNNVGRNMVKVGERTIRMKKTNSPVNIPIFEKKSSNDVFSAKDTKNEIAEDITKRIEEYNNKSEEEKKAYLKSIYKEILSNLNEIGENDNSLKTIIGSVVEGYYYDKMDIELIKLACLTSEDFRYLLYRYASIFRESENVSRDAKIEYHVDDSWYNNLIETVINRPEAIETKKLNEESPYHNKVAKKPQEPQKTQEEIEEEKRKAAEEEARKKAEEERRKKEEEELRKASELAEKTSKISAKITFATENANGIKANIITSSETLVPADENSKQIFNIIQEMSKTAKSPKKSVFTDNGGIKIVFDKKFASILQNGSVIKIKHNNSVIVAVVDSVAESTGASIVSIKTLVYEKYSNYEDKKARTIESISGVVTRQSEEDSFSNRLKAIKLNIGSNNYEFRKKWLVRELKAFLDNVIKTDYERLKLATITKDMSAYEVAKIKANIKNASYVDVFKLIGTEVVFSEFRKILLAKETIARNNGIVSNDSAVSKAAEYRFSEINKVLNERDYDTIIRDSISEISKALEIEFSGNIQEVSKEDAVDKEEENREDGESGNVQGLEEVNMDSWTLSPSRQAKHESLTIELKKFLSTLPETIWVSKDGKMIEDIKKDDIGNPIYLDEQVAFKKLLRAMQGYMNEKELLEKLKNLAFSNATYSKLYNEISPNDKGIAKNENLRAAFYRAMSSQFRNIYATKELKTGVTSWQVNRADDASRVMNNAIDNINKGNQLSSEVDNRVLSVYDTNGNIIKSRVDAMAKELIKAYNELHVGKDGSNIPNYNLMMFFLRGESSKILIHTQGNKVYNFAVSVYNALRSIGFEVDIEGVRELILTKPERLFDVNDELNIIKILTKEASPTKDKDKLNLNSPLLSQNALCGEGTAINTGTIKEVMRNIAISLDWIADGLVETGMFENGKQVNSTTNPSYESMVVNRIKNNEKRKGEEDKYDFIKEEYAKYSWFKTKGESIDSMARSVMDRFKVIGQLSKTNRDDIAFSSNKKDDVLIIINRILRNSNIDSLKKEGRVKLEKYISYINDFIDSNRQLISQNNEVISGISNNFSKIIIENEEWLHPWLASWDTNGKFKSTSFDLYVTNHAFNTEYDDWSKAAYQSEILTQYFKNYFKTGNSKDFIGIANPVLSDSPVAEFFNIRKFTSEFPGMKDTSVLDKIVSELYGEGKKMSNLTPLEQNNVICWYHLSNVAKQEVSRMAVVFDRDFNRKKAVNEYLKNIASAKNPQEYANKNSYKDSEYWTETRQFYDIERDFIREKVITSDGTEVEVVIPDFSINGIRGKGGTEFKFLPYLNDAQFKDSGKTISEYIYGISSSYNIDFSSIRTEVIRHIKEHQESEFRDTLEKWKKSGLFEVGYNYKKKKTEMTNIHENIPVKALKLEAPALLAKIKYLKNIAEKYNNAWEGKYEISISDKGEVSVMFDENRDGNKVPIEIKRLRKMPTVINGKTVSADDYMNEDEIESFKKDLTEISENSYLIDKYESDPNGVTDESEKLLFEFFNQNSIATALIEELFITDLAYYMNPNDFQKRYKQIYAPSQKLNTKVRFGREIERTLYLKDIKLSSNDTMLEGIKGVFEKAGFSKERIKEIIKEYKKNNVADAQAYRSPSSYRAMLAMAGELDTRTKVVLSRIIGDLQEVLANDMSEEEKRKVQEMGLNTEDYSYYNSFEDNNLSEEEKNMLTKKYEETLDEKREELNSIVSKIEELTKKYKDKAKTNKLEAKYNKLKNELEDKNKIKDEIFKKYSDTKLSKQIAEDSTVVFMTRKPFVYTQESFESGNSKYGDVKIGIQHKNSEFLLMWATEIGRRYMKAIGDPNLEKLAQIAEFMEEAGIDVVQFNSAVKVGCAGAIDLSKVDPSLTKEVLIKESGFDKGNEQSPFSRKDIVHELRYENYGIQASTPEHLVDVEQLVGSQIRRLILADISESAEFIVNGKKLSKTEYFNHYNALITENILESFRKIDEIFANPEKVEELLLQEMSGNEQYTTEMINAARLRTLPDGRKVFDLLSDPIVSNKIEALFASIIRKRITKQKIKGGACIQVSCFGCEGLQVKWSKDGTHPIEMECLMPAYFKDLIEVAIDENGVVNLGKLRRMNEDGLIDDETFDALTTAIGYRVPTEDKYSMARLRIKGFLPPSNGSAIMLPKEITTLSGSDFDVDKMYLMLNEFTTKYVLNAKSVSDKIKFVNFVMQNNDMLGIDISKYKEIDDILSEGVNKINNGEVETLTDYISELEDEKKNAFNSFFKDLRSKVSKIANDDNEVSKEIKKRLESEGFEFTKSLSVVKYKESDKENKTLSDYADEAANNSRAARNNRMISLMASCLSSEDTASKFLQPGSFDVQKKSARMEELLENSSVEQIKEGILELSNDKRIDKNEANRLIELSNSLSNRNIYSTLKELSLDNLTDLTKKLAKPIDPLSAYTQIYFHDQNANGGKLIGVYANHNAGHSMAQYCDLRIVNDSDFELFGERRTSLSSSEHIISKTNAGFLAASVDNVKDPVLSWLNQNGFTADMSMLLTRMGYDSDVVCLLMNQPIVKEVVKSYMNGDNRGSKEKIFIRAYKKFFGEEASDAEVAKELKEEFAKENRVFKLSMDDLALIINDEMNGYRNDNFYKTQRDVAKLMLHMIALAGELGEFTQLTKSDTQNGAAKATLADNIAKNMKIDKKFGTFDSDNEDAFQHITFNPILTRTGEYSHIYSKNENGKYTLNESAYNAIRSKIYESNVPFISAFDECGLNSIQRYLNEYMPHFGAGVSEILSEMSDMSLNGLSSDEINTIFDDLNTYWLTDLDSFRDVDSGTNAGDMRKLFAKNFCDYFTKAKNSINSNAFINALQTKYIDSRDGHVISDTDELASMKTGPDKSYLIQVLTLPNVGSLSAEIKQRYTSDWEKLYYSRIKKERELALNLLRYSFYRNGLGFSPDSFGHLAPLFRTDLPGYRDHFRNLRNASYLRLEPFIEQFVRNHPDCSLIAKFKPADIEKHIIRTGTALGNSGSFYKISKNKETKEEKLIIEYSPNIIAIDYNDVESIAKSVKIKDNGEKKIKYHKFISVNGDLYKLVEVDMEGKTKRYYSKMSKLGIVSETGNSNFSEYDINNRNIISAFKNNNEEYGLGKRIMGMEKSEMTFMSVMEGGTMSFEKYKDTMDIEDTPYLTEDNPLSNYVRHAYFKGKEEKYIENSTLSNELDIFATTISKAQDIVSNQVCS